MKKSLIASAVLVGFLAASASIAAGGEIKRTADGKPDFTGVYDISSITPFARPKEFGDKLYLTVEEAQANAKGRADRNASQDGPSASAGERAAPEKGGNVGAYNNFWFEWGSQNFMIDGKYRTSVLTDPPNGQMPAMTEEGKARAAAAPKFAWPNRGYAWWLESGDIPYDGPETNIVYEYACHEGNYAMGNTLRGARLLEAEYEKGQSSSGQE